MVTSYVQLLERKYGDRMDASAKQFIAFAVEGSLRMRRMVDDLLLLSRVDSEGRPFKHTEISTVVAAAIQNLEVAIDESGAVVSIDRPLPAVSGDEIQLIRLFQNLISNSIKFSGETKPEIRLESERDGGFWSFTVSDRGIGIPEDQMDRIFRVFQRWHREDEIPGTGIGLAVCKRIVERHKGSISVSNNTEKGCTFRFKLPVPT